MEHTLRKGGAAARGHRAARVAASLALAAAVVGASAWLSATLLFSTGDAGGAPATTAVKRGSLTETVTGTGKLAAASSATVTAPVDGTISEVRVAAGQQVAAGDVLFTIANPQLDQDVEAAQAALASAQADQRAAAGDLKRARAAAKDGTDESAATLDQARAASEKADAASTAAQQALEAARARADARTVRAPAAGTVMSLAVSPGTSVQAQSGTALAEIGDLTKLRVSLAINEVDVPKVAVGQKAEVTFPAVDGLKLEGTVTDVATQATAGKDSGSVVTYDVGLVIDAPDPRLKPGMSASADIAAQTLEDALVIPAGAVRTDADGNQTVEVWVPGKDGAEGRTETRKVRVLLKTDDGAAVEGDLAEGDQVVTSAAAKGGE
ncbi:efflux RND transporter periplasmic adaptor subunit [uncultured Parolsenella sp.]|uniref:efflux RND transporter periplasmic adaptor subunit n=1 Tax=uncultured Parolsenella sp. TaxID=2083008 RepID=UPI0025F33B7B|nr:efflux RND transporter periplasmic adaptor subunit [uncultured Parolsenella sp.]